MPRKEKWEPTQDDIKLIEKCAGFGMTSSQMAALLDISKKTFERRIADTPDLQDSLEKGRAVASHNIIAKAYQLCMNGNVTMLIFWLRCREGWKEEFPDIKGEIPIKINYVKSGDDDQTPATPVDVPKS